MKQRKQTQPTFIVPMIITGNSMLPLLPAGTKVLCDTHPHQLYAAGDIVAYIHQEGSIIIHRIITVSPIRSKSKYYLLKGDNNGQEDGYIEEGYIIGKLKTILYQFGSLRTTSWFYSSLSRIVAYCGTITYFHRRFYSVGRVVCWSLLFLVRLSVRISGFVIRLSKRFKLL